jgi:hypothetical protein
LADERTHENLAIFSDEKGLRLITLELLIGIFGLDQTKLHVLIQPKDLANKPNQIGWLYGKSAVGVFGKDALKREVISLAAR